MSVARAILVGQLLITLPILIIFLIFVCMGVFLIVALQPILADWVYLLPLASIFISVAVGWTWWSFVVPRWRRWALKHGVPANELQKWGVITGLVWPKGSIFEKTEFKLKD